MAAIYEYDGKTPLNPEDFDGMSEFLDDDEPMEDAMKRGDIFLLKQEASRAKRQLIDIHQKLREISPAQGERLDEIIAALEKWQNT